MKLLTYILGEATKLGVLSEDMSTIYPIEEFGLHYLTMNELIENTSKDELAAIKEKIGQGGLECISYDSIKKSAPIPEPKQDIICLGINYMAHAEESARYKKEAFSGSREYPVYFSKRVNLAVGDGEGIEPHFDLTDSLDYEAELAVIIGRDAKDVPEEEAYEYVFGYTILNDISAREVQTRHKQWYFGKSMDGYTPMGPYIVTADEIGHPPALTITSKVNGELRQNSTTDLLIFPIHHVIHELSQGMTLKAGTIISMGTPAGVGMGFQPPKFLKKGDIVECEIEGIGKLVNYIL